MIANLKYRAVYCDIVHRCNMECANCYLPNRLYPDIDKEKMFSFIDKFDYPTEFRFIGGEPTLHPDLDKIIAYAVENGHRTSIATNGLKIASNAYLSLLKDAGLKTVYLSMTGFDEDSVYEITDLAKCAKGKMKALNNVIDLNLRLSIGCIIIKDLNEHLIEKIFDYLKERNVKSGTSIEYRNIGQVGRYMTSDTYTFTELKNLVCEKLKIENIRTLEDNQYSYAIKHKGFRINLTNWNGVSDGFDEDTNSIRGRMTEQFDVVPFLQHIKDNEGGY